MNRRGFLSLFGLGVAGIALEQAIPLGRVWSFPKNIVLPTGSILNICLPAHFLVGDILTFSKYLQGPYVVTGGD